MDNTQKIIINSLSSAYAISIAFSNTLGERRTNSLFVINNHCFFVCINNHITAKAIVDETLGQKRHDCNKYDICCTLKSSVELIHPAEIANMQQDISFLSGQESVTALLYQLH